MLHRLLPLDEGIVVGLRDFLKTVHAVEDVGRFVCVMIIV
jgi:hypothetical protein